MPKADTSYADVERDLNWYYNRSAAALGIKSSWSSFVSALWNISNAGKSDPDPYTPAMLKAARRLRDIEAVLSRLPRRTQRILDAIYNQEYRYPSELVFIYGTKTGAALFVECVPDLKTLVRLASKRYRSSLSDNEKQLSFVIGTEAKRIFREANEAYRDAKKLCGKRL